jgi:hypothetical protein
MFTILLLAGLGFVALIWLVSEPITGLIGSTLIGKVMALIVAFKLVTGVLCWLVGSGSGKVLL